MIAALAGAGVWFWLRDDVVAGQAAGQPPPASAAAHAAQAVLPQPPASFPNIDFEAPLAEQVDRLLATRNPEQAMAAYWLLARCDDFNRDHDRLVFDAEELKQWHSDSLPGYRGMTDGEKQHDQALCATLTERMRQSRIDYLALAAKAGVAGASTQFIVEGPFGDRSALVTRPTDPLVLAWKETARAQLTRDAEAADLGALSNVWIRVSSGDELYEKNPALAYRYRLAMANIFADVNGASDTMSGVYGEKSDLTQALARELTPEQIATETAAARRIADIARQRRKQAGEKP